MSPEERKIAEMLAMFIQKTTMEGSRLQIGIPVRIGS